LNKPPGLAKRKREAKSMLCPNDQSEMNRCDLEGVQVDECAQCGGIWFDQGELDAAKDIVEPDLNWIDVDLWRQEHRFDLSLGARRCPRDNSNMVSLRYGDPPVEIEHCLECRGMWLERDEFRKMVSALEEELDRMSASDYLAESLKEAREIISGEENLASQWKDLRTIFRLFEYRVLVEKPALYKALYAIQRTGLGLAGYNQG
jgi:Zn-finger nucleic acid-binding protein